VILSFLFGPAAAWGSGLGNLMADTLGGMLGPGSLFGFIGNFFYAYLPYTLWRAFMGTESPVRSGARGWVLMAVILVTSSLTIGAMIGWGADLLRLAPFGALGPIIAVNNLLASAAISTVLLALLYERVQMWGLLYFQILDQEDEDTSIPQRGRPGTLLRQRARIGAILCMGGSLIAFVVGLTVSAEALGSGYGAGAFEGGAKGTLAVAGGMAPGLLLILLGAILL
jgi:energy-coupling factor transport system substrate-specific component